MFAAFFAAAGVGAVAWIVRAPALHAAAVVLAAAQVRW